MSKILPSLHKLCYIDENNELILNCLSFKQIATNELYDVIIQHILETIQTNILIMNVITAHMYMKSFTLTDFEKHLPFITKLCKMLTLNFPDKLEKCLIYNAPFFISKIYNVLSSFIDKKTQQKIKIISL